MVQNLYKLWQFFLSGFLISKCVNTPKPKNTQGGQNVSIAQSYIPLVNGLLLRSIIFNVGTASYQLGKYLAKLLSPLSKSQYMVNSTK